MKRKQQTWYLRIILAPGYRRLRRLLAEVRRLLTFRRHLIRVFLQIDDPYSYLLSHYLRYLVATYKIELRIYLGQALQSEFMPQPALLAEYATRDCRLLARELGIPFLDRGDTPVFEHRRALLDFLAEEQGQDDFQETTHAALSAYWRGDAEAAARLVANLRPDQSDTNVLIAKNQLLLRKLGHYSSASMHYAGEWYVGVDRLMHLCARLDTLRARRKGEPAAEFASLVQASQLTLPGAVPDSAKHLPSLEMYHSFRSPYSYLALPRIFEIADAFGITLDIRPVLPMVMRGLPVPRQKILYIVKDASREAERLGIPFGNVCDPLGTGAERCIAVFYYARSQGKQREFMLSAGRAIWSEAIDVATDDGMRVATERAGLFWPDVLEAMSREDWRENCQKNRDALTEAGLWGVPCFVIGDVALWGQDRDWLLARQIEDMCHDGEGILI